MDLAQKNMLLLLRSAITGEKLELVEPVDINAICREAQRHSILALMFEGAVNCGVDKTLDGMEKLLNVYCSELMLSEKQLSVLKRLAVKYQDQLTGAPAVFQALQIDAAEAAPAKETVAVKELLSKLAAVTNWEPPIKKGRFTFDDKKFYQSLAKQDQDGKVLSAKQITALEKLAEKYPYDPDALTKAVEAAGHAVGHMISDKHF